MSERLQQVGRLALRQEGEMWNAYFAHEETMDGAILLGSIRLNAVLENRERKQAFMDLMRDVLDEAIAGSLGITPEWGGPQPAPERERAGSA